MKFYNVVVEFGNTVETHKLCTAKLVLWLLENREVISVQSVKSGIPTVADVTCNGRFGCE